MRHQSEARRATRRGRRRWAIAGRPIGAADAAPSETSPAGAADGATTLRTAAAPERERADRTAHEHERAGLRDRAHDSRSGRRLGAERRTGGAPGRQARWSRTLPLAGGRCADRWNAGRRARRCAWLRRDARRRRGAATGRRGGHDTRWCRGRRRHGRRCPGDHARGRDRRRRRRTWLRHRRAAGWHNGRRARRRHWRRHWRRHRRRARRSTGRRDRWDHPDRWDRSARRHHGDRRHHGHGRLVASPASPDRDRADRKQPRPPERPTVALPLAWKQRQAEQRQRPDRRRRERGRAGRQQPAARLRHGDPTIRRDGREARPNRDREDAARVAAHRRPPLRRTRGARTGDAGRPGHGDLRPALRARRCGGRQHHEGGDEGAERARIFSWAPHAPRTGRVEHGSPLQRVPAEHHRPIRPAHPTSVAHHVEHRASPPTLRAPGPGGTAQRVLHRSPDHPPAPPPIARRRVTSDPAWSQLFACVAPADSSRAGVRSTTPLEAAHETTKATPCRGGPHSNAALPPVSHARAGGSVVLDRRSGIGAPLPHRERAWQDSNLRPSPPEGDALSN